MVRTDTEAKPSTNKAPPPTVYADGGGTRPAPSAATARPAVPAPPTPPAGGAANAGWIESNQGAALVVAAVLIATYVFPIYMISFEALYTGGFQEPNFLLQWFGAFLLSADSTLNEYHKVLFPVMSALSVVAFRTRPDWRFLLLAFFVLVSFSITVAVSVAFDVQSIQHALSGMSIDARLSKLFFSRIQETLLMYLMMLLGIGVSNSINQQGKVP